MKKNILFALCCASLLAFTACSDDYTDASTKHVYGENENPYLKSNEAAQMVTSATMKINIASAITRTIVNLADYATQFEEQMGMSVDGTIKGLEDGSIVFYPINTTRNQWLKTAYTKDNAGWYFNSANQPCAADDADKKATVILDKASKTLVAELTPEAAGGTALELNVGFAKNGSDYDSYLRFTLKMNVQDPTLVALPYTFSYAGAYTVELPDVKDEAGVVSKVNYEANIKDVFGLTIDEFVAAVTDGTIQFRLADSATGEWKPNVSAGKVYYTNVEGAETTAEADDFAVSVSYEKSNNNREALIFEYNDKLAEGTTGVISVGFVDKNDASKSLRFVVNYTIGALGK